MATRKDEREATLRFRFIFNQTESRGVVRELDTVQRELAETERADNRLESSLRSNGFEKAARDAREATTEVRKFNAEVDKSAGGIKGTEGALKGSAKIASGLGVGALGGAGNLGADILGMAGAMGPLGIALTAATAGLALFTAELDRQAQATKERLDLEARAVREIRKLTREQLQARFDALKEERDIELEIMEMRQREAQEFVRGRLEGLGSLLYGEGKALADSFRESEAAVKRLNEELGIYERALENNATAANDAADAQRRLTEALLADTKAGVEARMRYADLERNATSQQIRDLIDASNRRKDAILAEIDALMKSGNTSEEVSLRISELTDAYQQEAQETANLTRNILPLVEAREREAAAAERLAANYSNRLSAIQNLVGAEARLAQLRMDQLDADRAYSARYDEIYQDFRKQQTDNEAEFRRQQIDALDQHHERLRLIQRTFDRSWAQSVGDRNALAAYQARTAYNDQRDDERANFTRQQRQQQDAYDRQQQALRENIQRQLDAERRRWEQDRDIRARAIQQTLVDISNYQNQIRALEQQAQADQLRRYQAFWQGAATFAVAAVRQLDTALSQATNSGAIANVARSVIGGLLRGVGASA